VKDEPVGPVEAETRFKVAKAKLYDALAGLVTFGTLAVVALTVLVFVVALR